MPTSTSYNITKTRDQIITRALRIIGAIGQGEIPQTTAVTEAAEALNDLIKEWETDGMQLWCVREYVLTPVAGTASYAVGTGLTINAPAPTKILQAWSRTNTGSLDTPILIITRQEYNMFGGKTSQGSTSQMFYNPPGEMASTEASGSCTLYVVPDAFYAASSKIYFTGVRPIADFDSASDIMDFPQWWGNAVVWGLAEQLAFEYGIGATEKSQIAKKALEHKERALSYGTEDGHLLIQPVPQWRSETW